MAQGGAWNKNKNLAANKNWFIQNEYRAGNFREVNGRRKRDVTSGIRILVAKQRLKFSLYKQYAGATKKRERRKEKDEKEKNTNAEQVWRLNVTR